MSPAALLEFIRISQADWDCVVPLAELLDRINRVAVAMTDVDRDATSPAGRVKPTFTERSFRHYQTLGCIDVPEKHGRLASYGYHHFVQALLVRRLLSERMSSEQIAPLLAGRDTKELERLLHGGVEIKARLGNEIDKSELSDFATELMEIWNRVSLAPGLELNFSSKLPPYTPEERRRVIARVKEILRRQGI